MCVLPHRIRLLAIGSIALLTAAILPAAQAADEYEPWKSTNWTGVVAGAPQPGKGLPEAPMPAVGLQLPEAYDIEGHYEGQSQCDPTPKPGAKKLANLIKNTYGSAQGVYIPRNCSVGGQSEHKEGRALDWMVTVRDPQQRANAEAFLNWLLAPDATGKPYAMARRIGIMYIGWNDRMWRGYDVDKGWTELKGCFKTPEKSRDTYCHRDHIHISLTWDGATGKSSFWDGTPFDAPFCPKATSSASTPAVKGGLDLRTIKPVRVVSTAKGKGVPMRCRLQQDRWAGDSHRIFAKVTGRGDIPKSGVSAVAVRVVAVKSNAPAQLRVWSPGQSSSAPVLSVPINGTAESLTVVPVSSEGTIAIATSAGATDVVADVIGYFTAAPASVLATGGTVEPVPATKAYDTTGEGGPIGPGETRTVSLGGKSSIPAGATAAFVSVTVSGGQKKGAVLVGAGSRATKVAYPKNSSRTGTALVALGADGTTSFTNKGSTGVNIRVESMAWASKQAAPDAGTIVPIAATKVIDTAGGVGISGTITAGRVAAAPVVGKGGIPAKGVQAVLLAVTTSGGSGPGWISMGPGGSTPNGRTVGVIGARKSTSLAIVPVGADGSIVVTSPSVSANVSAYAIGFIR